MTISDHLTSDRCPNCKVYLFRAKDAVSGEIVFCSECLAGGSYKEVVEKRGGLASGYVTRQRVDDFLREIRADGE